MAKSMSFSDLNARRISAFSFFIAFGFVRRRNLTPESRLAVVSDPAMRAVRLERFECEALRDSRQHRSWNESQNPNTHGPFVGPLEHPLNEVSPPLPSLQAPAQLGQDQLLVLLSLPQEL